MYQKIKHLQQEMIVLTWNFQMKIQFIRKTTHDTDLNFPTECFNGVEKNSIEEGLGSMKGFLSGYNLEQKIIPECFHPEFYHFQKGWNENCR
jgi:hypothetical protein